MKTALAELEKELFKYNELIDMAVIITRRDLNWMDETTEDGNPWPISEDYTECFVYDGFGFLISKQDVMKG